jgi:hypothetical protein
MISLARQSHISLGAFLKNIPSVLLFAEVDLTHPYLSCP